MAETEVVLAPYTATQPGYRLAMVGSLEGEPGKIGDPGSLKVGSVLVRSGDKDEPPANWPVVVRAKLPSTVSIPVGLIRKNGEVHELRSWKGDLEDELKAAGAAVRDRFLALARDGSRRLLSIEVSWKDGAFLDSRTGAAGQVDLQGEAKLHLAAGVIEDRGGATLVAEFRASVDVAVTINGVDLTRSVGLVCRLHSEAAAVLAIELDDLTFALPEIACTNLDLTDALRLPLPSAKVGGRLAGIFGRLLDGVEVEYRYTNSPELVLVRGESSFYFAVMKGGLSTDDYDLANGIDPKNLAIFQAVISKKESASELRIVASGVQVGRWGGGSAFAGAIKVANAASFSIASKPIVMGPLRVEWDRAVVDAVVTKVPIGGAEAPEEAIARALVHFTRLSLRLVDDPATVMAFSGQVELTPCGARILDLQLVEPYPWKLINTVASALVRGAERILQILGRIQADSPSDVVKLRELLRILGKMAAAVARSAVHVADAAADLLYKAVATVSELLVRALEALQKLFDSASVDGSDPSHTALEVELRIGLDPPQLRQIVVTCRQPKEDTKPLTLPVLGFQLEVAAGWKPALLLDLVTHPGAYLVASRIQMGTAAATQFGALSTDLWMKGDAGVEAMRDATAAKGDRPTVDDKPLVTVRVKAKDKDAFCLVVAGVRGGEAVFLQRLVGGKASRSAAVGTGTAMVDVVAGPFQMKPLESELSSELEFQKERVLPLFGTGEPAKSASPGGFLDRLKAGLGQVVWVKSVGPPKAASRGRKASVALVLGVRAAGVESEVSLEPELDLDTLQVSLTATGGAFAFKSRRIEQEALGLTWVVEQQRETERLQNAEVEMFTGFLSGGESSFRLNTENARMELRFGGLSGDGQGVVLAVESFSVGRAGLDVKAKVTDRSVSLSGIDVPFRFTSGGLTIRAGKLEEATIAGHGQLPPALVGEAGCTIALTFVQNDAEGIVLQSGKVELEKKGEPISCHGTRFTLTISDLDIAFVRDGGYHFYFLVTGSLRFTPKPGEFEDGLLKNLAGVEISLERAPLTADPRVLARYVSFQKALNPKKTFPLFNIFTFELRGFGFHGSSPKFGGDPAVNVSGQIQFAQVGDVMQPNIDFHGLWIAPPKGNESLPRIKADGLGVDLQLGGAVKIRGSVLAVDPDTRTVTGDQIAPPGYDTYGFLGEGQLDIAGWGSMEASMGFLEVAKKETPTERKKAFFLYLQKDELSVEIPTPFWTFYLREAGFGFGYRYTLAGISAADRATSPAKLVKALDDVSKRQGDLARFSSWSPDPERDAFTLALRGAFQPYQAAKTYDEKREAAAESPFFFDVVAALRSDLTLLMNARCWLGVNYSTFRKNTGSLREKPGMRGYLYISAPRSELLARCIADSSGFIGENWAAIKTGNVLREALQSTNFSSTLYIRPGLFHYEMGWPDQLSVELSKNENMRISVRGGMIFRAAEDGLLLGYNISADAFLKFEGRAGGSLGVAIRAELNARFVARVLAFLAARLTGSFVYGLVSLDARVTFSVEAWMDVDLFFGKITLRIGFSFSLQFTAAVELVIATSGVGGRVSAQVAIQAFGCTLGVGIGFSFNDGELDAARARVQRFMALSITSEEPDSPPVFAATSGDKAVDTHAETKEAFHKAPPPGVFPPASPGERWATKRAEFGRVLGPTEFRLVLRSASVQPGGAAVEAGRWAYGLLVPCDANDPQHAGFYAAPSQTVTSPWRRAEDQQVHTLGVPSVSNVRYWKPGTGDVTGGWVPVVPDNDLHLTARWNAPVPGAPPGTLTLAHLFDECFLTDTEWVRGIRETQRWSEPTELRKHGKARRESPGTEAARDLERSQHQDRRAALAIQQVHDERAFQGRSTVLTMFLDQFVSLSETGTRPVGPDAHVTDLGVVLFGPVEELEKLEGATITKHEVDALHSEKVTVFNKSRVWFDRQDPRLDKHPAAIEVDGIKLDWTLAIDETGAGTDDPEHLLHHYEIRRTIEGMELTPPKLVRAKAAATTGGRKGDEIELLAPRWQYADGLQDLPDRARKALLPSSGEMGPLAAAQAWLEVFGGIDEVTITYRVTPVDVAGARGSERAFLVDVPRPAPSIRPAVGELRLVQEIGSGTAWSQKTSSRPKDLSAFIGLNDLAWADGQPKEFEVGPTGAKRKYEAVRSYELILDPDGVEPAGHYGSDAATARLRGRGAWAPQRTADEVSILIPLADLKAPSAVNCPDVAAGENAGDVPLKRWAQVTSEKLLDSVWARGGERVATRFFLETVVTVRLKAENGVPVTDGNPLIYRSRRVPLPFDHWLKPAPPAGPPAGAEASAKKTKAADVAAMRPESFEWAVPLVLPALSPGRVSADSGLARFVVPKAAATLGDVLGGDLESVWDPERRVLTRVRFAAAPDWASSEGGAAARIHASTIAGFDLHELDLDELARLDTADGKDLSVQPSAWRRARRVARIEQLSPDAAMLEPQGNTDLLGWQAHYPSETFRLSARSVTERPGQRPIRSAWYSASESTPRFPARRPRLRLLPTPPEDAISALLDDGRPLRIEATLTLAPGSAAELAFEDLSVSVPDVRLVPVFVGGPPDERRGGRWIDKALTTTGSAFALGSGGAFRAADVRDLLLSLGMKDLDSRIVKRWLEDPATLDGLTLVLVGKLGAEPKDPLTGRAEIPLDLRSPIHPLLEESLSELALEVRDATTASTYRRYTVMTQPPSPADLKDVKSFLASTGPSVDPYGWGVLQSLGLAVSLRLYDSAKEAFLDPAELAKRVQTVLEESVLERWKGDPEAPRSPFVDVFLRPGADRLAGSFDAIRERELAGPPAGWVLKDKGLAFVQLSLRPMPVPVWSYLDQELEWNACPKVPSDWPVGAAAPICRGVSVEVTREGWNLDVAALQGGAVAGSVFEVTELSSSVRVPIPIPTESDLKQSRRMLGFRTPDPRGEPRLRLVVEWEILMDTGDANQVIRVIRRTETTPIDSNSPFLQKHITWKAVKSPGEWPDPFERFQALAPDVWAAAFGSSEATNASRAGARKIEVAGSCFEALLATLRATARVPFEKTDATAFGREAATYLTWAQRFLDHGRATIPAGAVGKASIALAAPIKATPWRLAADSNGYLSLGFLHSDHWAHARAYAVQPFGRYATCLSGIGVDGDAPDGGLSTSDLVGYAIAVSPRTERIEAPVILGSTVVPGAEASGSQPARDASVQIVVARHGEEALATSNRPLFARLGLPTSLVTFGRAYRAPFWPGRLRDFDTLSGLEPETLPERLPGPAVRPTRDLSRLGGDLGEVASDYPDLWKGADVWRVGTLPPHYRLIVLASARAGVVVSEVAGARLDDLPRAPLARWPAEAQRLLGEPSLEVVERAGRCLQLRHRLVSHDDLTPAQARGWTRQGGAKDICWWPDPDVVYVLSRVGRASGVETREEDAEIRLVATGDENPAEPVVVRARGTRYESKGIEKTDLETSVQSNERVFRLASRLTPRGPLVQRARLRPEEQGTTSQIEAFNDVASHFGWILTPYQLEIDLKADQAADGAAYIIQLDTLSKRLKAELADAAKFAELGKPGITPKLKDELARLDKVLSAWIATADKTKSVALLEEEAAAAVRPSNPGEGWPYPRKRTLPLSVVTLKDVFAAGKSEVFLEVFDLPLSAEVTKVVATSHPVALKGERLARLVSERVFGAATAFKLKAVDGRSRIPIDPNGKPGAHPGIVEADVALNLPEWFEKSS